MFLFVYHTEANFVTWAGASVTMTGVYHWLIQRDAKIPDARDDDAAH